MILKLITEPVTEPVTLTEAKSHCRIDGNDEDADITLLITAAREWCEKQSNRAFAPQTWELIFDDWPCFPVNLPRPPLTSVTSVKYYGTDNTEYTLDTALYFVDLDSEPGRLCLAYNVTLPNQTLRPNNAVRIRYGAGGTLSNLKKQAIKMLIGYWYENREAALIGAVSKEIDFAVTALLGIDRVVPT